MPAPYLIYSENGCLLCREVEGTLRLLFGDKIFDQYFRVVKLTFQLDTQQLYKDITKSATIPKLYRGDFRTGEMVADSFDAMMSMIASGEMHRLVGLEPVDYPTEESADSLIIGGGPGAVMAFSKLQDAGLNPLLITETVGGKLVSANKIPQRCGRSGVEVFRQLIANTPNWGKCLRPGIEVDSITIEGQQKTLTASGRTYRINGPLVLATGISIQHFDLQEELDYLDQGLGYRTCWNKVKNQRVTVYAMRGQTDQAYVAAQQLSRLNNDVTIISPSPLSDGQRRVLSNLFLVNVIEGRLDEVVKEGDPPQIVAVKTGNHIIPTDWLLWNEPFRSRAKALFKDTFGTDWLNVDEQGRVLDASGRIVSGVYGVGDAIETNEKSLEAVIDSASKLDFT